MNVSSSEFTYIKKNLVEIPVQEASKINVITVGAAIQDVFLLNDEINFIINNIPSKKMFTINVTEKNNAKAKVTSTGGGATNVAVTLARQGFQVEFMGKINKHDSAGKEILSELKSESVGTKYVKNARNVGTGYSTIILLKNGEHIIFTYRGASESYELSDFSLFRKEDFQWLYISSLGGNMDVLEKLLVQANLLGKSVLLNPGNKELSEKNISKLIELLRYVDVLSVNRKEAMEIVKGNTLFKLIRSLLYYVPVGIITDGSNGAIISDGQKIVRVGVYDNLPTVDSTGGGDAFASGFLSQYAIGSSLKKSAHFASANSRSVVCSIGSKNGILKKDTKLHDVKLLRQYDF